MFHAILHMFDFSGRSTRKDYWSYIFGIAVVALIGGVVLAAMTDGHPETQLQLANDQTSALIAIFMLVLCFPHLALIVRRLHDFGWSGWAVLLLGVPVINFIVLLMVMFRGSVTAPTPNPAWQEPPHISIYNSPSVPDRPEVATHVAQIERLASMHAQGILTAQEFAAGKAKVLRQ